MKFDCGDRGVSRRERMQRWHPWFAWRPVRLADHDCRWLEIVERKGDRRNWEGGAYWTFEYRATTHNGEGE